MLQAPPGAGGAASGAAAPACGALGFTPSSELAFEPAAPTDAACPATGTGVMATVCDVPAPLLDIGAALTPDATGVGVGAELGAVPGSPAYASLW
jgi:hypothetical protein